MMKRVIVMTIICCFLSACSFYRVDSFKVSSPEKQVNTAEVEEKQIETDTTVKANEEEPFHGTDTMHEDENHLEQELVLADEAVADLRITMLGDSLTEGIGDQTGNGGYLYFLKSKLKEEQSIDQIHFETFGKKGLTSAGLKKKMKEEEIIESVEDADIVIITIGGNDVMGVVKKNFLNLKVDDFYKAIDKYEANIRNVIEKIRKTNQEAEIYLVGIYNPFQLLLSDIQEFDMLMDIWNERSGQFTAEYERVHFVEIGGIFEDYNENLIFEVDYFHPNTRGYERMGHEIYMAIKENSIARIQHIETTD